MAKNKAGIQSAMFCGDAGFGNQLDFETYSLDLRAVGAPRKVFFLDLANGRLD